MPKLDDELLEKLSRLLGRQAMIEGRVVQVVDILPHEACLVLCEMGAKTMQESLYGQARRRAARHFQIPLQGVLKNQLHPVLRALLDENEQADLLALLTRPQ
ncbi:MAG: hypothetical protein AB1717_02645 [Pseudomonadota bacterium]